MVGKLEQQIRELDCPEGTIAEIAIAASYLLGVSEKSAKFYLHAKRKGYCSLYKCRITRIKERYGSINNKKIILAIKRGYNTPHEYFSKCKKQQKTFEDKMELRPLEEFDIDNLDVQEQIKKSEFIQKTREVMKYLSERQKYVIGQRYFEGRTLIDIGKEMKCTKERARQIEEKALEKLRRLIAS